MSKEAAKDGLKAIVRLRLKAGKAAPSPAIGQALGPLGLNMAEFCRDFNAKTAHIREEVPIPVRLKAFNNRTYAFDLKTPPAVWFLKRAAGIDKGATQPGRENIGYVTLPEIYEIAKVKKQDQPHADIEGLVKSLMGTASAIGLKIRNTHP